MSGPPPGLVRTLVQGPSLVAGLEWHDEVGSTQAAAAEAARAGKAEVHVVLADVQTAGRGRLGRRWHAPPGASLLASFVLRPTVVSHRMALLPLLAGVALAEVAERYCPGVALKWPNDLLVTGRKAAGILVERAEDAMLLGVGVNVDWRGVERPTELTEAVSLAEAAGFAVDRWRVLAAFAGVFGRRYLEWHDEPLAFLDAYRRRCATVGASVRVARPARPPLEGVATQVGDDGALLVRAEGGETHRIAAGDVEHVRRV